MPRISSNTLQHYPSRQARHSGSFRMKFLLDENTEFRLAGLLKDQGHDVTAIAHDYPHALPDQDVLALAASEQRVLITNDQDFGALIFKHRLPHAGVILFRLEPGDLEAKRVWLEHILTTYADRLSRTFVVVTEKGVRTRE
jgi:predicted nuclease of predicted toxin-antitoxin system